jgi:hypothetical protein
MSTVEFVNVIGSKEDWSVYKLDDGTIVKMRFVLIKAIREANFDQFGNPTYSLNSQNVVGIIPLKSALGTPSPKFTPEEVASSVTDGDIKFKTIKEPWNEFQLEDGSTVNVKLILTMVARTSKFDEHGEPIYLVNSQPIVKGIIPPELRQKKEPPHPTFKSV